MEIASLFRGRQAACRLAASTVPERWASSSRFVTGNTWACLVEIRKFDRCWHVPRDNATKRLECGFSGFAYLSNSAPQSPCSLTFRVLPWRLCQMGAPDGPHGQLLACMLSEYSQSACVYFRVYFPS